MGKEWSETFVEARDVFQEVDDALSQKLSKLMFEGPETDLTLTENAQPAIMAASLAILRVLEKQGGVKTASHASLVAGHSLGEYSALAAAGSLSLADTAKLLKLRGKSMQQAVPVGVGAMAALLGAEFDQAKAIAERAAGGEVCEAANDNAPGQVVLSGHTSAIDRALEIAKEEGIKRAVKLTVSAPFHCALMEPAAKAMEQALANATIHAPSVPLIANVTAAAVQDPAEIRKLLVAQVTGMVRWRESVLTMHTQGLGKMVEIGAGKVLTGLAKRIAPDMQAVSVSSPAEMEAFLNG